MFGEVRAENCPPSVSRFSSGCVGLKPLGATRYTRPRRWVGSLSPVACPPTPGSYQSETYSAPSGPTHTSDGRNQLSLAFSTSTNFALYPAPSFGADASPFFSASDVISAL